LKPELTDDRLVNQPENGELGAQSQPDGDADLMKRQPNQLTRREALTQTGALLGAAMAGAGLPERATAAPQPSSSPFIFCLNTATIRGQKLGIVREIEVAAQAGYHAIEPWVEALEQYVKAGGSLKDLRQRIADAGLTVEGAVSFAEWLVDDDARRARGLERAKQEMDLVAQIGGKRIAAPPAGATRPPVIDLAKAAERYRALLDLGDQMGVVPALEMWGASANLSRLSHCLHVAMETSHPKACVLADVFHLYRGGSPLDGLKLASARALPVFHLNDYPAEPPRDKINDSFRLMPGDGVAPLTQILQDLRGAGGTVVLSLELFNRKYWEQDALATAREGLAKMKAVVAKALG
jgi:sugar phosphate isomerase/epimerase